MIRLARCLAVVFGCCPVGVHACDTALILTIDVSNSVDPAEYRLQVDGMADALVDPEIVEAMVRGQAAIAVVQWSGTEMQETSIPWTQVSGPQDALRLSEQARLMPRAFVLSDTAPAEAIYHAMQLFETAPPCVSQVIDISGDGTPNAGRDTETARQRAERAGITINGIAIESLGMAITTFFERQLITRDGFVITARTHRDYPDAIRQKIIRELTVPLG